MRNIWTIAIREYKHFFISPIAYVVALAILLLLGILFYGSLVYSMTYQYPPSIQVVLSPLVTILLFTTPAITMRTLAEEQKNGTLEILLTAPVRDWEVVAGKWLGGVLFLLTILLITWFYPIVLNQVVEPGIDQGLMVSGYLGIFLLGSAFLAVGVMASSFFSNQIAAFFATLVVLLVFWVIGYPADAVGSGAGDILRYLDFTQHFFQTFYMGVISLRDVVFYLSVIAIALFTGSLSVEARRWR
jgi:ABC-2 type transport system permease protein